MKISTKGRYALRIMLDIATTGGEEPVRVKDISKRQDISAKYMEQIVGVLTKSGLLRSIRGPQGGYVLTKHPADYTAGEILRAIEGDLAPVACLEGTENTCPRQEECVTLRLWRELNDAISKVVDGYTLEDMVEWQKGMVMDYII